MGKRLEEKLEEMVREEVERKQHGLGKIRYALHSWNVGSSGSATINVNQYTAFGVTSLKIRVTNAFKEGAPLRWTYETNGSRPLDVMGEETIADLAELFRSNAKLVATLEAAGIGPLP